MALTKFYFILLTLVPSVFGQCSIESAEPFFQRSVYEFSISLSKRIAEATDSHFIASALSSWTLLAVLSLGAANGTYEELADILRLHPQKCFNYKMFDIVKELSTVDDGAKLERSSAIYVDESMAVSKVFQYRIAESGVCNSKSLQFDDFSEVAREINDFISAKTNNHIQDVVSADDLAGMHLILIDAIYFKGTWSTMFAKEDTEQTAFYNTNDVQIGDVEMMFVQTAAKMIHLDIIAADILELPYGNKRFSMIVFLPDKQKTIQDVLDNLKRVSLLSVFRELDRSGEESILISLPKFTISSDLSNLKELLIDMGLTRLFSSTDAEFPDISDFSLYVSDFIQKAKIEVNEEGTEASAASSATMTFRTLPKQFQANRPFLFIIVDKVTKMPIFTGGFSKPQ